MLRSVTFVPSFVQLPLRKMISSMFNQIFLFFISCTCPLYCITVLTFVDIDRHNLCVLVSILLSYLPVSLHFRWRQSEPRQGQHLNGRMVAGGETWHRQSRRGWWSRGEDRRSEAEVALINVSGDNCCDVGVWSLSLHLVALVVQAIASPARSLLLCPVQTLHPSRSASTKCYVSHHFSQLPCIILFGLNFSTFTEAQQQEG